MRKLGRSPTGSERAVGTGRSSSTRKAPKRLDLLRYVREQALLQAYAEVKIAQRVLHVRIQSRVTNNSTHYIQRDDLDAMVLAHLRKVTGFAKPTRMSSLEWLSGKPSEAVRMLSREKREGAC